VSSLTSRLVSANGRVMVSAQDELSEAEPKAAVQGLQATGSPQKTGVQKQLPALQGQRSHGECDSSVSSVATQGRYSSSRIAPE
jgi:hypothetical protein